MDTKPPKMYPFPAHQKSDLSVSDFSRYTCGRTEPSSPGDNRARQCFGFQILIKSFLDTLSQKKFFQILKMNNFRSDLTDISARKEALAHALDASMYCFNLSREAQTPTAPCQFINTAFKKSPKAVDLLLWGGSTLYTITVRAVLPC